MSHLSDPYAPIAAIYDRWCASVTEDLPFYLEACAQARGPVVEVGAGTGRITIPLARAGHSVVAVDNSAPMLERLSASAAAAGVQDRITIVQADINDLPTLQATDRVIAPFRVLLHLVDDAQRTAFLARARTLLIPGGRIAFDVFEPTRADIDTTHNRILTRETGVTERARWDARRRHLDLEVSFRAHRTSMRLCWTSGWRWRALLVEAGFAVIHAYHGFDGEPYHGQRGDSAWIAERID